MIWVFFAVMLTLPFWMLGLRMAHARVRTGAAWADLAIVSAAMTVFIVVTVGFARLAAVALRAEVERRGGSGFQAEAADFVGALAALLVLTGVLRLVRRRRLGFVVRASERLDAAVRAAESAAAEDFPVRRRRPFNFNGEA